ncbi:acyltransferase [Arthrobacter sp. Soil782]|uniref:acyltransferase family protein n=1 Tax=Arthrobacter sp. Soil782 TaxID=1736410 RepID=UPI0006F82916|nr:acyltransferase family protein [Arthrobacter sp. Soil782]KRF08477.1 acyltransferase [Arthrobacter sp. Soil782]
MVSRQSLDGPQRTTTASVTKPGYRHEVQGLRALAVLMVVVYHVWLGRVSGGVDVFLLISSFLLTLSFTRKIESQTPLELLRYWSHLFKRLVPLASVTIAATLAAVFLLVPQTRWQSIFDEAWAALFYYENWLLAANSVDYYAADHSTASPFQHFWSLSIQGQVFILWPLLFAMAALIATRWKLKPRAVLIWLFATIFLVSLAFSVWQTQTNQSFAYFDLRTRLWEFALGSLIALLLPLFQLSVAWRVVFGWAGIAAMLAVGIVLDVEQQFPGYIALWPTLAAAAVMIAGSSGSRFGVDRLLRSKPLMSLGDASYALYLVHWPLLVIFLIVMDRQEAGPRSGAVIILISIAFALIATRFIDKPLRSLQWAEKKRRRSAVVIAAAALCVSVPLGGWQLQVYAAGSGSDANNPGAASLRTGFAFAGDPEAPLVPAMTALDGEWVWLDEACSDEREASDFGVLQAGCTEATVADPTGLAVVVGASHPQQWVAAIGPLAKQENWNLVVLRKGQCPFGAPVGAYPEDCENWNSAALDYLDSVDPDVVFTVASSSHHTRPEDLLVPGYQDAVERLTAGGAQVVAIRDNPRYPFNVPECVERHGPDSNECSSPIAEKLAPENPAAELAEAVPGLHVLDMSDLICPGGICTPVVGNVLVYMDDNHLSATYIRSMQREFNERVMAQLNR